MTLVHLLIGLLGLAIGAVVGIVVGKRNAGKDAKGREQLAEVEAQKLLEAAKSEA